MKKFDYLNTMLKNGNMHRVNVISVSKKQALAGFFKCYDSIFAKFEEIAKDRVSFRKSEKDSCYLFLNRYKEIVAIQLERNGLQEELKRLNGVMSQLEGLLMSLKYERIDNEKH